MKRLARWLCCVAVVSVLGCGQNKARQSVEEAAQEHVRVQFDKLLAQAKKDLEAARYDEAIKSADEALKIRDDPEVRELLGQAKEARHKAHKEAYDKALRAGRKAMEDKEYQAAADAFLEAVGQLPDEKEAHEALADAQNKARRAAYDRSMSAGKRALQSGDYQAAADAFREALRLLPDDHEAQTSLQEAGFHLAAERGQRALEAKQYGNAVAALSEAVRLRPDDKDCQTRLELAKDKWRNQLLEDGRRASASGRYEEAIKAFSSARDVAADGEVNALLADAQFQERLQRGRKDLEANNLPAAVAALTKAAALKPDNREARDLLEEARRKKAAKDEAEYQQAMVKGQSAASRKDWSAAVDAYTQALQKKPADATASGKLAMVRAEKARRESYDRHLSAGNAALLAKKFLPAEREFQAALRDLPNDAEASRLLRQVQEDRKASYNRHLRAGNAALLSKNLPSAEREAQAALQDMPNDADASQLLRKVQDGKAQQAKKESYGRHLNAGNAALFQKDFKSAEREFQAALVDMPGDAKALDLLQQARRGKR
jgi:tetratricopeptide (TPR) repeat protein